MTKFQKFKIFIMTILIAGLVCGMNFVMCRQAYSSDAVRVKNFYKLENNSLDMVMIGASTTFTNYSAPLAFKEFGYTSYSLGTNGAPMGLAKSMLIEVLKTQNPKVIIIDINGILYDDKFESKEGSLRAWIDNMPYSQNKIKTIQELVPEDDRLSYYVPFLKYHSNWAKFKDNVNASIDELTHHDDIHLSSMGIQGTAQITPQKSLIPIKTHTQERPMYRLSGQHLKELLDYCQNHGLKNILFTNMPRYYSKKMIPERERNNAAKALIHQYGYEYIDMDDYVDEIGLNPQTDFYNQNHLNIYGQKKLTMYLGKRLNEKYHLSDTQHDEKIIQRYQQEVTAYEKIYKWVDEQIRLGKKRRYNYKEVKEIIEKQEI